MMKIKLIKIISIFIITNLSFVQTNYLLGGTISWKPQHRIIKSSNIPTIITQSYQWNKSSVTDLDKLSSNGTLKCVNESDVCGGFRALDTIENCVDCQSRQILNIENLTENTMFCIAFQNQYRSMSCCINLNRRPDGKINSSPVTNLISPIRIPINSTKIITIPIVDIDNDYIHCRWAVKKSSIDECGDICEILPETLLNTNNCTLTFDSNGKTIGDIYGIALIIEDFYNQSTISPLSSIPLQFFIEITKDSNCLLKPQIYSNINRSTTILLGKEFIFNLTIIQGCPNTNIIDFLTTLPLNMIQTNLTYFNTENLWKITHTWIPSKIQLGVHVYCALAMDNMKIQSDEYCLIFNVIYFQTKNFLSANISSTAAPSPTVTQTVLVPDSSGFNYDFSNADLALALGLSLPLLFLLGCLFVCRCCCQHTTFYRWIFSRQNKDLSKITSNENSLNNLNQKSVDLSPDYRQQYINQTPKLNQIQPTKITIENSFSTQNDSFSPKLSTKFDENSENRMQTAFVSPSTVSFATSEVLFSRNHSFKSSTTPINQRSVLFQAYSNQEKEKKIFVHK